MKYHYCEDYNRDDIQVDYLKIKIMIITIYLITESTTNSQEISAIQYFMLSASL